jgi:hypothetical protein
MLLGLRGLLRLPTRRQGGAGRHRTVLLFVRRLLRHQTRRACCRRVLMSRSVQAQVR